MVTYKFDVDCVSDAGLVKPVNEDSYAVLRHDALENSAVLVAVADGVGGLDDGERASSAVVDALEQWWHQIDWAAMPGIDNLMQELIKCVNDANSEIYESSRKKGRKSGTTLSALLFKDECYQIFHVGDSRIYCVGKGLAGNITTLTEDHSSLLPKVVNNETIMRPVLTECIGYRQSFSYQQTAGKYQTGEIYIVCSDGIFKTLQDKKIGKTVQWQRNNVKKACRSLIAKAKNNKETDNLTAAVIRIIN